MSGQQITPEQLARLERLEESMDELQAMVREALEAYEESD